MFEAMDSCFFKKRVCQENASWICFKWGGCKITHRNVAETISWVLLRMWDIAVKTRPRNQAKMPAGNIYLHSGVTSTHVWLDLLSLIPDLVSLVFWAKKQQRRTTRKHWETMQRYDVGSRPSFPTTTPSLKASLRKVPSENLLSKGHVQADLKGSTWGHQNNSGVAPANQTKERAKTKSSWISPFFAVGFWQNGFFADFYFWAAGFFRGFSRRIFSPHFCGKSAQKNSLGKSPGKSSKIYTTKILQHISADCPGQHFCEFWCFALGKPARFTFNVCSEMPLWRVHDLTFLWFGLPGPLLNNLRKKFRLIKMLRVGWHAKLLISALKRKTNGQQLKGKRRPQIQGSN